MRNGGGKLPCGRDQQGIRHKSVMKESLIEQIQRYEGLRLKPYRCTAEKLTIGYGRNLDDVGISEEEAEMLLENDIVKCERQVKKSLPWTVNLDQARQSVLINMCFNLGIEGLLKFKNTLKLVEEGKYEEASEAMRESLWAAQVGNRATELAQIMKEG